MTAAGHHPDACRPDSISDLVFGSHRTLSGRLWRLGITADGSNDLQVILAGKRQIKDYQVGLVKSPGSQSTCPVARVQGMAPEFLQIVTNDIHHPFVAIDDQDLIAFRNMTSRADTLRLRCILVFGLWAVATILLQTIPCPCHIEYNELSLRNH
jgi:hypothetical protein